MSFKNFIEVVLISVVSKWYPFRDFFLLRNHCNPDPGQVVAHEKSKAGSVNMAKLPWILDLAFDTVDPLFQSFEDFHAKFGIDSLARWYKLRMEHPFNKKNTMNMAFIFNLLILAFLLWGGCGLCHSALCLFVSGSYSKIHDSTVAITLSKKVWSFSQHYPSSSQTIARLFFWSLMRTFRTSFAHPFLICKSSVTIRWIMFFKTFSVPTNKRTLIFQ